MEQKAQIKVHVSTTMPKFEVSEGHEIANTIQEKLCSEQQNDF